MSLNFLDNYKDTFTMDPSYDVGPYEAPSGTIDDNFFKYDPETTGGIDWADIYANPDVLKGSGNNSDLLGKGLEFLGKFAGDSYSDQTSQYYDKLKTQSGLPTDKSKDSWYSHVPGTNVGFYGGSGYGSGLPAIQAAQSLGAMYPQMTQQVPGLGFKDVVGAGMRMAGDQLMNKALYAINPVLGAVNQFYPGGATEAFKDVTRFAGGVGNTVAKGVGSVVEGGIDFIKGLFGCDERLKVDIAPLENTEVNDELAQVAFFVKGLHECS